MSEITHYEIGLLIQRAVDNAKSYLKKTGYMFPTLFFLKKGKPVEIKYSHKSVIAIETDNYDENDPEKIYRTVIGFKITDPEDDEAIFETARKFAYKFDAIFLVISCLYNEWSPFDERVTEELQSDPEAIKLLHTCYYLKQEKEGNMLMVPYINRGKLESEVPTLSDKKEKTKYDVTFTDYFWTPPLSKIGPKIPNPFKE